MGIFKNLFGKKEDGNELWKPLPVPNVVEQNRQLPLGPYTLQKHLGDLQQVRPPYKAQIWQAVDDKGQPCSIGVIEPGEEKMKWLKERLGTIQIQKTGIFKVQGELRKIATQLNILAFDTLISERYLIKKCLIADPIQETYEAWDNKEKEPVYCTVYIPGKSSLPDTFSPRNKKSIKLQLPQILEVLNEGMCRPFGIFGAYRYKYPALYYIISRHIPGANFTYFFNQWRGRLSVEHAGFLLSELAQILQHLQERNIVHGNIRPQTLWIGSEKESQGHLYLNAFSIIDTQDDKATANTILLNSGENGYPTYMAPEQISHTTVDYRCDSFTAGLLLYNLILGKSTFSTTDIRLASRQLSQWKVPSPFQLPPRFNWLAPTLEKMLQPNPENRNISWENELQEAQKRCHDWSMQEAEEIVATPIPASTSSQKTSTQEKPKLPVDSKSNSTLETYEEEELQTASPQQEESTSPQQEESTSPQQEESTSPQQEESTSSQQEESTSSQQEESTSPQQEESTSPQQKSPGPNPTEFEEWEDVPLTAPSAKSPTAPPESVKPAPSSVNFFSRLFGRAGKKDEKSVESSPREDSTSTPTQDTTSKNTTKPDAKPVKPDAKPVKDTAKPDAKPVKDTAKPDAKPVKDTAEISRSSQDTNIVVNTKLDDKTKLNEAAQDSTPLGNAPAKTEQRPTKDAPAKTTKDAPAKTEQRPTKDAPAKPTKDAPAKPTKDAPANTKSSSDEDESSHHEMVEVSQEDVADVLNQKENDEDIEDLSEEEQLNLAVHQQEQQEASPQKNIHSDPIKKSAKLSTSDSKPIRPTKIETTKPSQLTKAEATKAVQAAKPETKLSTDDSNSSSTKSSDKAKVEEWDEWDTKSSVAKPSVASAGSKPQSSSKKIPQKTNEQVGSTGESEWDEEVTSTSSKPPVAGAGSKPQSSSKKIPQKTNEQAGSTDESEWDEEVTSTSSKPSVAGAGSKPQSSSKKIPQKTNEQAGSTDESEWDEEVTSTSKSPNKTSPEKSSPAKEKKQAQSVSSSTKATLSKSAGKPSKIEENSAQPKTTNEPSNTSTSSSEIDVEQELELDVNDTAETEMPRPKAMPAAIISPVLPTPSLPDTQKASDIPVTIQEPIAPPQAQEVEPIAPPQTQEAEPIAPPQTQEAEPIAPPQATSDISSIPQSPIIIQPVLSSATSKTAGGTSLVKDIPQAMQEKKLSEVSCEEILEASLPSANKQTQNRTAISIEATNVDLGALNLSLVKDTSKLPSLVHGFTNVVPQDLEIPTNLSKENIPQEFNPDSDRVWEKEFEMVKSSLQWEDMESEEEDIIGADGGEQSGKNPKTAKGSKDSKKQQPPNQKPPSKSK